MAYNDLLDIEVLEGYLDGKLDAKAMHQVEKLSLEDPFVAQALEGLATSKKRTYHLSLLQKQLQERLEQKPIERKMWRLTSHRLSIAATAAVVFISVSILFWMRETNRQKQAELAAMKPKNIEVDIAPQAGDAPEKENSKNESQVVPEKVQAELDHNLKNNSGALARNNKQKEIAPSQEVVTAAEPMAAQAKRTMAKPESLSAVAMSSPVALSVPKVDSISSKPQPLNGWAAYQSYLIEQNRVSKNQELGKAVELHFTIDKNGLPTKIEITRSAGAQFDNEAVRLLKEGPKWKHDVTGDNKNSIIIKF